MKKPDDSEATDLLKLLIVLIGSAIAIATLFITGAMENRSGDPETLPIALVFISGMTISFCCFATLFMRRVGVKLWAVLTAIPLSILSYAIWVMFQANLLP